MSLLDFCKLTLTDIYIYILVYHVLTQRDETLEGKSKIAVVQAMTPYGGRGAR